VGNGRLVSQSKAGSSQTRVAREAKWGCTEPLPRTREAKPPCKWLLQGTDGQSCPSVDDPAQIGYGSSASRFSYEVGVGIGEKFLSVSTTPYRRVGGCRADGLAGRHVGNPAVQGTLCLQITFDLARKILVHAFANEGDNVRMYPARVFLAGASRTIRPAFFPYIDNHIVGMLYVPRRSSELQEVSQQQGAGTNDAGEHMHRPDAIRTSASHDEGYFSKCGRRQRCNTGRGVTYCTWK